MIKKENKWKGLKRGPSNKKSWLRHKYVVKYGNYSSTSAWKLAGLQARASLLEICHKPWEQAAYNIAMRLVEEKGNYRSQGIGVTYIGTGPY